MKAKCTYTEEAAFCSIGPPVPPSPPAPPQTAGCAVAELTTNKHFLNPYCQVHPHVHAGGTCGLCCKFDSKKNKCMEPLKVDTCMVSAAPPIIYWWHLTAEELCARNAAE